MFLLAQWFPSVLFNYRTSCLFLLLSVSLFLTVTKMCVIMILEKSSVEINQYIYWFVWYLLLRQDSLSVLESIDLTSYIKFPIARSILFLPHVIDCQRRIRRGVLEVLLPAMKNEWKKSFCFLPVVIKFAVWNRRQTNWRSNDKNDQFNQSKLVSISVFLLLESVNWKRTKYSFVYHIMLITIIAILLVYIQEKFNAKLVQL